MTGNETDPNLSNNTSTVITTVDPEADLAIVKSGSPNPVTAGQTLTYTLTATNNGPSNATGVTVVDTLPAGVTYASSTTTQGSASDANNVVTMNLGNMATGATATATIIVNVASTTVGNITNTATISGTQPDPNMANNTATATTTSQSTHYQQQHPADRSGDRENGHARVRLRRPTLTYTLNVTNYGGSAATGVTVTDTLPATETLLSDSSSQGTMSVSGNTITVALGSMADLGTASVTLVVRVNAAAGSTVTNSALP